jgi:hypothetical protein
VLTICAPNTETPAAPKCGSLIECAMGVTPGVADPLLKVALPGNLDEGDGAPKEDNCKLGLMCSENGDEKTPRRLEPFTLKVVCST